MNARDYQAYVEMATKNGEPIFQNDQGMSPRSFGMIYVGSSKRRHNNIKRKQLMKH